MRGQRQLTKSSAELSTTFERLSSGQRINKASDDAAGLAIADSLNANSRVFNQGVRNLNDGLSLLNIADKAIENLSSIVIRLEELAVQSANGVYTNKQRKALDGEAQALSKEFFRISKTTEFNGQKLFIGENPLVSLQAGIGQDAIMDASVGGAIGTGGFSTGIGGTVGAPVRSGALADFDGDGHLDLAVAIDDVSDYAFVFLGRGNGAAAPAGTYSVGATPQDITTGDLNADGFADLVVASEGSNSLHVLLGSGNGSFAPQQAYLVGNDPESVAIGDVNGDGIMDLVSADGNDSTVSILLGAGGGSFNARYTLASGTDPGEVIISDLNDDGISDLVTADSGDNTLSVFLGLGGGSFNVRQSYAVGDHPVTLEVLDLNNDQVLDLVSGDRDGDSLSVLLGSGNGVFSPAVSFAAGDNVQEIESGDFNADGFSDLAVVSTFDSSVNVFISAGDGSFSSVRSYAAGIFSNSVKIGDFNEDGVLDLLTLGLAGQSVGHFGDAVNGVSPLQDFSLLTVFGAKQAMPIFRRRREQLASQRGEIGANQAKIEVAANVLTVASENFKAAESRIRDADIASEAANLTRLNILQQAASSILAQANQQPSLALQLLS